MASDKKNVRTSTFVTHRAFRVCRRWRRAREAFRRGARTRGRGARSRTRASCLSRTNPPAPARRSRAGPTRTRPRFFRRRRRRHTRRPADHDRVALLSGVDAHRAQLLEVRDARLEHRLARRRRAARRGRQHAQLRLHVRRDAGERRGRERERSRVPAVRRRNHAQTRFVQTRFVIRLLRRRVRLERAPEPLEHVHGRAHVREDHRLELNL